MVKKIFFRAKGWFVFINFTKFDFYRIFAVVWHLRWESFRN